MRKSLAYLNHNRWVCDCPESGCTDARLVYEVDPRTGVPTGRRLSEDVCAKGHPFEIVMPPPGFEARVTAAVADRVDDADKSWYPQGHTRAALAGLPTGQSVDDLIEENTEVARFRAAQDESRKAQLATILAGLGVKVRDDGTFEGSVA
jgi:hypothetical protein